MTTRIDEGACRRVQAKLDAYLDNELLTETNLELLRHVESCAACAGEAAARRVLRARLQIAVRQISTPAGLETRLRASLHKSDRPNRAPWLMAIAAAILACVATWGFFSAGSLPAGVVAALRVGLDDHVHCAVIRQRNNPARNTDKLAPQYKPILAAARQHVPAGMQLAVAHECHFSGRTFIHMTFRDDHHLLSVIVTRKGISDGLSGLRSATLDGYPVAGTEAGGYLIYTASDLSATLNRGTLRAMAPSLRNALARLEAQRIRFTRSATSAPLPEALPVFRPE